MTLRATSIPEKIVCSRALKQSKQNVNINGLDYDPSVDETIVLKTCVGVNHHWFNEWLFPKLYDNKPYDEDLHSLTNDGLLVESFCATFPGIIFERMQRYPVSHYRWIKNYNSLADYLKDVMQSGIWDGYNLEYLQICTPPLSLKLILKEDLEETAKLKEQIKFHFILMMLLDWILQH